MNQYEKHLISCIDYNGCYLDLRKVMEMFSLDFDNLSIDDVRYIESECRELRVKFDKADKVKAFKVYNVINIGFSDTVYFSLEEEDLVKELTKAEIDKGNYDFKITTVLISESELKGHIKDRIDYNS